MSQYLVHINANTEARSQPWQGFIVEYDHAKEDISITDE
jgi:hypothetical protein